MNLLGGILGSYAVINKRQGDEIDDLVIARCQLGSFVLCLLDIVSPSASASRKYPRMKFRGRRDKRCQIESFRTPW